MLWARVPRLFIALAHFSGAIDRKGSPIPPALRSLVTVRVSQINGCHFCVDLNTATLLKRGVSLEKAAALAAWRSSELFDDMERDVLDYAEAVTEPGGTVDDPLMSRLKARFDEDAMVELTALIAFQNLSSKFNATLGVPSQGFCPLPVATDTERGSGPAAGSKHE